MASTPRPRRFPAPLRRPLTPCLIALCAGVMTAGCGGADQSSAPSSLDAAAVARMANASPKSSSASPSASSSAGRFAVPEAAKAHTRDGAVAFVKFYWETLGKLDAEPRTGVLPRFALPECKACAMQEQSLADSVRKSERGGASNAHISDIAVRQDSAQDVVVVRVVADDSGTSRYRGKEAIASYPPAHTKLEVRADWVDGHWVIHEVGTW